MLPNKMRFFSWLWPLTNGLLLLSLLLVQVTFTSLFRHWTALVKVSSGFFTSGLMLFGYAAGLGLLVNLLPELPSKRPLQRWYWLLHPLVFTGVLSYMYWRIPLFFHGLAIPEVLLASLQDPLSIAILFYLLLYTVGCLAFGWRFPRQEVAN
jgi:hypothetical protein